MLYILYCSLARVRAKSPNVELNVDSLYFEFYILIKLFRISLLPFILFLMSLVLTLPNLTFPCSQHNL